MVPVSLYFSNIAIVLSHPHILSVKAMCKTFVLKGNLTEKLR